jgi:hypothetical protein
MIQDSLTGSLAPLSNTRNSEERTDSSKNPSCCPFPTEGVKNRQNPVNRKTVLGSFLIPNISEHEAANSKEKQGPFQIRNGRIDFRLIFRFVCPIGNRSRARWKWLGGMEKVIVLVGHNRFLASEKFEYQKVPFHSDHSIGLTRRQMRKFALMVAKCQEIRLIWIV